MRGVRDAVSVLPACAPMFIRPETVPAEGPAMKAETAQKELWARYSAPAPPARTSVAVPAPLALEPRAMNTAACPIPKAATPHRPVRLPRRRLTQSEIIPPRGEQTAIAANGSIL